ncbi:hypothetical protein [Corallococcus terminator]|nr:hypothetical protein [Corallococcus terminator]
MDKLDPLLESPGPLGWQNFTIDSFLDASASWAEASSDWDPRENPWRRCASILFAGKFYE